MNYKANIIEIGVFKQRDETKQYIVTECTLRNLYRDLNLL
jgi:hypothetical protein